MPRGWRLRGLTAGVSVLGVLGLAALPPEHLHARPAHDGRRSEVVHRHFDAHHPADLDRHAEDDGAAPRWLDSPYVHGVPAPDVHRTDACAGPVVPVIAPRAARASAVRSASMSILDPPPGASFGLRAPPIPTL